MSLSIRYGDDVPPALAAMLEHHARQEGLSLHAMEVLGASLDFVEAFIVAAEEGRGYDFAAGFGLMPARDADRVALARWQAQKLFG